MKKSITLIIFLIVFSIAYSQTSQKNILIPDSTVLITKKQFRAASSALIELKSLKKQQGLTQQRIQGKDAVIQYYEREFPKYRQLDSVQSILIKNKNKELELVNGDLKEYRGKFKLQKAKTIGLAVSVPAAAIIGFLLGFYLHP